MKNRLFRKGLVLVTIILFVGTSVSSAPSGGIGKIKDQAHGSIPDTDKLDWQFIYNITAALSNIIFTEYDEERGELAKGRAFGSKGERKAAEILYENMSKLGLYAWKEPIKNIPEDPYVASKLEIWARGLTVYDKNSRSKTSVSDCYISPKWDLTAVSMYIPDILRLLREIGPILGPIAAKLMTSLMPRPGGPLDQKYNFYSVDRLTRNYSNTNLKVVRKPTTYSMARDLLYRIKHNEPFVYIDRDPSFTQWPDPEEVKYRGFLYKTISKIEEIPTENILWALFQPNCKGLIKFDSDHYTYSMNIEIGTPLPYIYVNRTIGEKIYENPEDFEIDFYINQRWNETVESYNVIGQLNGTDPSKTVIVDCLYDSWWCQGTADSAIGMAIVLGIAKYFTDHNITPKYNIKFIGFCGEEAGGGRGATYYEIAHPPDEENLVTLIDLNQVGFSQPDPPLELLIFTNNASINKTITKIADEAHYLERVKDVADLKTKCKDRSYFGNYIPYTTNNSYWDRSSTSWIYVVKDTTWLLHHHDGMGHEEGDVLKYYDPIDVNVTSEMIWNITKFFTINPDCWFEDDTFATIDSSDDDLLDSVKATFTINTSIPHDLVMVKASLENARSGEVVDEEIVDYIATSSGLESTITLTVPEHEDEGWYKCTLDLYNSTGRLNELLHLQDKNINDTIPWPPEYYYLYPYS